jgi:hypothetical protein
MTIMRRRIATYAHNCNKAATTNRIGKVDNNQQDKPTALHEKQKIKPLLCSFFSLMG